MTTADDSGAGAGNSGGTATTGPDPAAGAGPDDRFDASRLRTVLALRRPHDDRIIAGVCSGLARYLRLDPVVVRVLLASLSVVGGLGLVLYATIWLLTPDEGSVRAPVGRVDAPRYGTVRVVVLLVAACFALGALIEAGSLWWAPWPALLVLGIVAWLLLRERDGAVPGEGRQPGDPAASSPAPTGADTATRPTGPTQPTTTVPLPDQPPYLPPQPPQQPPRRPPRPVSPERLARRDGGRLLLLTAGVVTIALAAVWLLDRLVVDVDGPVGVAVALGVVGAGATVGGWYGNGRPLILPALLLGALLAGASLVPDVSMGERRVDPSTAAGLADSYELGVGRQVVDLTRVADLEALDGRTLRIETGVGETVVFLPEDGLDVTVEADAGLGEALVLGRTRGGPGAGLTYRDPDTSAPDLTLLLENRIGRIEVDR